MLNKIKITFLHKTFCRNNMKSFSSEIQGRKINFCFDGEILELIVYSDNEYDELESFCLELDSMMYLYLGSFPEIKSIEYNGELKDITKLANRFSTDSYFNRTTMTLCDITSETVNEETYIAFKNDVLQIPFYSMQYLVSSKYKVVMPAHRLTLMTHVVEGVVDIEREKRSEINIELKEKYNVEKGRSLGQYFIHASVVTDHFIQADNIYNADILKLLECNEYTFLQTIKDTESIGAIIFVDNAAYPELKKVNAMLVNMLDAFLTDTSSSSGSNFDDSEKMKMLKEHGAFVLAMLSDNKNGKTTSQDMVTALTAKNIFLPINNDGVVGNIGIINQKGNKIDEHELIKAIGVPENVFVGNNGRVNIACASGLGYPVEYITKLGKSAVEEQKKRMEKRESLSTLDDLGMDNIEVPEIPKKKTPGKRKQITWDFINSL